MRSSLRTWRGLAAAGTFALAAACNESPVELPLPTTLLVFPTQIDLAVGDAYTFSAQVLDQDGRVVQIFTPVHWTSDNETVARITTGDAVTAFAAGTATITATHAGLTATAAVNVTVEPRVIIRRLDILADSARGDVNTPAARRPLLEFRALDGFGTERCTSFLPYKFRSNTNVATLTQVAQCQFQAVPAGAGSTWVVAEINNAKDSVYVTVTNITYTAAFTNLPNDTLLKAGDTVAYEVTVTDEAAQPVANVLVSFNVTGGGLSARTATTGSNGKGTVQWYLPQKPIGASGTNHTISFLAEYPSGALSTGNNVEPIVPNRTASFVFSSNTGITDTIAAHTTALGLIGAFFVQGYDKFGNARNTAAVLTHTNPDIGELRISDSGNDQQVTVAGYLPGSTSAIVTEHGLADTLPVVILAGPTMVFRTTDNAIRIGQITTAYYDTTVYNGTKATHSPVWTTTRDTVAFMLTPLSGGWAPFAAAANGNQAANPVSLVGGDTASIASTYEAGFPVFKTRSGTMGDVIFISDSAGNDESNVYIVNRSNNAITKVTANNNPYVLYRGLALKPDESKVLVATYPLTDATPADGDSSVASNVFEIDPTTGNATQITQNTDTQFVTGIDYHYAAYSPDGSRMYIDRSSFTGRHLLVYEGGAYREFDVGGAQRYQPTFNPGDAATIAYRDGSTIFFRRVTDPQSAEVTTSRNNISYFSWSRR
ncbi:MAG: Ig-like domain-containing protein [Gemmatimonadetes bacterium]|nr:Ig-like domain-containing protein [Gemmatimonadota bacterium]